MKTTIDILNMRTIVRADDFKPTTILIVSALLLALHRYFGSIEFAVKTWTRWTNLGTVTYMFASIFLLLGLIPLAIVHFVFHDQARDYGVTPGDWKTGLLSIAILFPIIATVLLYPASQTGEMRAFYPFVKHGANYSVILTQGELLRLIFFYTAWEFFFRGFMLFGLRKHVGDWTAICIQTIPSCLWHIGSPGGELFSSIAAGVLLGLLAIRTGSIVWPFILHVLIGITLDLFIVLT